VLTLHRVQEERRIQEMERVHGKIEIDRDRQAAREVSSFNRGAESFKTAGPVGAVAGAAGVYIAAERGADLHELATVADVMTKSGDMATALGGNALRAGAAARPGTPPPAAGAAAVGNRGTSPRERGVPTHPIVIDPASQPVANDNAVRTLRATGTDGPRFSRETEGPRRSAPPATPTPRVARGRKPRSPQVPEHVRELPLLDRGLPNYSLAQIEDFFRRKRADYPPAIQQMIDEIPVGGGTRKNLEAVDRAIRDVHTAKANQIAGYGAAAEKPFVHSRRGASNEGGKFSQATTDNKTLTLHGQLKSGGTVEFDQVAFTRSRLTETKMNLDRTSQQEVFDQMHRQAAFARDWGFSEVRWEVWDFAGYKKATRAHAALKEIHPELGARVVVEGPE
jgi:hypothetical protein